MGWSIVLRPEGGSVSTQLSSFVHVLCRWRFDGAGEKRHTISVVVLDMSDLSIL
jgi:hypothetical protein